MENEETVCLFVCLFLYNPHYNVAALQFTSGIPFSNTFFGTRRR